MTPALSDRQVHAGLDADASLPVLVLEALGELGLRGPDQRHLLHPETARRVGAALLAAADPDLLPRLLALVGEPVLRAAQPADPGAVEAAYLEAQRRARVPSLLALGEDAQAKAAALREAMAARAASRARPRDSYDELEQLRAERNELLDRVSSLVARRVESRPRPRALDEAFDQLFAERDGLRELVAELEARAAEARP